MTFIETLALTFDFIGMVLIAVMILITYKRITNRGATNKTVLHQMNKEKRVGILGIIFIVVGYIMRLAESGVFG